MAGTDGVFYAALLLGALVFLVEVDYGFSVTRPEIPTSLFLNMKNVNSTADFIDGFLRMEVQANDSSGGRPVCDPSGTVCSAAVSPDVKEDLVNLVAVPASCQPRPTPVPVPDHEHPDKIYYPFCVIVERCGGCCGHDMLECIPTLIQYVNVNLIQCTYPYAGAENFIIDKQAGIVMEQHLRCSCQCRIQPEDCSPNIHDYIEDSCNCVCKNEQDAFNCRTNQKWDHQTCSCTCPELRWCPMDEYFSNDTCRCEQRPDVPPPSEAGDGDMAEDVIDPCQNHYCRAPFAPSFEGGQCVCRLSDSWGTYSINSRTKAGSRSPRHLVPQGDLADDRLGRYRRVPNHPQFYNLRKKRAANIILP